MALTRAQKVTLAVGVPLTVAAIGWGGLNAVAAVGRGSEPVSLRLPVSDGRVAVYVGTGDLRLARGSGASASLTGTVKYSLFRPGVSQSQAGGRTSVSIDCRSPVGWCGGNLSLYAPADATAADLSTGKGNIEVSGPDVPGTLSLATSMGDVSATGISASDVSVSSDMGDITLTFTRAPDQVRVTDAMGDISIVLPPGTSYRVMASTSLGDKHTISSDPSSPHVIEATTSMGNVSITESS